MPQNETGADGLSVEELRRKWSPEEEAITDEYPERFSKGAWTGVDQKRLREALSFGLSSGYASHHIAVSGISGYGVLEALKNRAADFVSDNREDLPEPMDWCYVYNFDEEYEPVAIPLKRGIGKKFKKSMEKKLNELKKEIPEIPEREDVVQRRNELLLEFVQWHNRKLKELQDLAEEDGFEVVLNKNGGLHLVHIKTDEDIDSDEEGVVPQDSEKQSVEEIVKERGVDLADLPPAEVESANRLREKMEEFVNERREKREENENSIEAIVKSAVEKTVDKAIEEIRNGLERRESRSAPMSKYLEGLRELTVDNYEFFLYEAYMQEQGGGGQNGKDLFLPWRINVFIDNTDNEDPPVVIEKNPTYENLIGKIGTEITQASGGMAMTTDHTKIMPGSLARANGGYLILNLRDVLVKPGAYEALKNVLKSNMLEVEDIRSAAGLPSMSSMKPGPVPMRVKLIVAGSSHLWRLLSHYDEETSLVFGVKAEARPMLKRNSQEASEFAAWVKVHSESSNLMVFSEEAIGRMIEFGSRLADNQSKFLVDFEQYKEIMHEASYYAQSRGSQEVSADDVRAAAEARVFRSDLIRERIMEAIEDGTFIYDFKGKRVGEGYGLLVYSLPDISFGKPGRLSARTYVSPKLELVSADKEADLAGKMTVKAHATIAAFLRGKFPKLPLRFGSSFSFEESYNGVDGPSASLIELLIRVSSLAEVPIRQDIAMTGSMDQHGKAQVIGGVNQKVEGTYSALELTGSFEELPFGPHGAVIPHQNAKNLMLNEKVVKAVEEGKFAVWKVENIDQAIEIFTGMEAGEPDENGSYPEDTFWGKVESKIKEYSELAKDLYGPKGQN